MSTTYFRGLTRSQYEAFERFRLGQVIRKPTQELLHELGLIRWAYNTQRYFVPGQVKEEYDAWRSANYHPDGRRIHHRKKGAL